MKSILLITEGFPFGHREQSFIHSEYDALAKRFQVFVLAKDYSEIQIQKGYEEISAEKYSDDNKMDRAAVFRKAFAWKEFREELRNAVQSQKTIQEKIGIAHWILYYANLIFSHMKTLRRIILENHVDAVYSFWCKPATVAAVLLKKEFPDLQVFTRFHGADLFNEREKFRWQPFRNYLSEKMDGLFFACEYGRNYFLDHWKKDGAVYYLGSSPCMDLPDNGDRFVLISCSNLIPLKRVELIIRGLASVDQECRIDWFHFGDGELREETEKLAQGLLDSKGNIHFCFMGFMDYEEMLANYQSLSPSLFITTSSTEGGVPISILEALSMGIPCIGTNVGGIPDAVKDGVNGILLKENPTPKEIAGAIEDFYRMGSEEKKRMRQAARKTWESKFNAKVNADLFAENLLRIISLEKEKEQIV